MKEEKKCTVEGKGTLLATDPNCKEEMCTVEGMEELAANDPNCTEETSSTDGDGDGIADTVDQCADTPEGAMVNAIGCADGQTPATPAAVVPENQRRLG